MPIENNGDTRLILHRIDQLGVDLKEVKTKQDVIYEGAQSQIVELQKQTALMQQSHETICKTVGENKGKIERNDFWTKIIGALTGILIFLGGLAALVNELIKVR